MKEDDDSRLNEEDDCLEKDDRLEGGARVAIVLSCRYQVARPKLHEAHERMNSLLIAMIIIWGSRRTLLFSPVVIIFYYSYYLSMVMLCVVW